MGRSWALVDRIKWWKCNLVVNEEFESVLGVLQLQETLKEHGDEGSGLLDEDPDHHRWVLCLLQEVKTDSMRSFTGLEGGNHCAGS